MEIPDGWSQENGGKALVRSFKFKDFSTAFAFLTRVAMHAEKVDHHPEFTSIWNRVDFRLTTHDTGGVDDPRREAGGGDQPAGKLMSPMGGVRTLRVHRAMRFPWI